MATAAAASISDEQARFFLDSGYLVLTGVLSGEELERLRGAMDELTAFGSSEVRDDPDFMYGAGHKTGRPILKRIEYVIDKSDECKVLLGHPFILRSVAKLIGPDLIPTWDSMVLKMPGEGITVPWHRDAGAEWVADTPIFNVDFYLDHADLETCVWAYPGSHLWSSEQAAEVTSRPSFSTEGAVPLIMQPGDVLFHNILLLHGSPQNDSDALRRVVYYEFRSARTESERGPHTPEYIPLKQQVLLRCLERRAAADWISPEEPYKYNPPAPHSVNSSSGAAPDTYRYPHEQFCRGRPAA